jgi:hypothetical protein
MTTSPTWRPSSACPIGTDILSSQHREELPLKGLLSEQMSHVASTGEEGFLMALALTQAVRIWYTSHQ